MFLLWCVALSSFALCSFSAEVSSTSPVGSTRCGENEVFSSCTTACPLTCDNWAHPPSSCEKLCITRCACVEGSVEYRGKCIPKEKCPRPPACYYNETFQDGGYDCATCRNYKTAECPYVENAGCYCKPGYIRNTESDDCILAKDCPLDSMCEENEFYQEGGYDCANCVNYRFVSCQFKDKAGCYCKPGYVWNPYSEDCVLMNRCPKVLNGHG